MATAKKVTKAAKPATGAKGAGSNGKGTQAPIKPIKEAFNKTSLIGYLAERSGVEPRSVKAVMAALEGAMVASVHKKGLGNFTPPGLLKVTALQVPAKKARKGINPFTKEETTFKAKPATVKLKVRPLKKLKDAAL
jgi:nucleoid DNA-binding protein